MSSPIFDNVWYGDAEAMVVDILQNHCTELQFSTGKPVISTNLIGYTFGARWITVHVQGGLEVWPNIYKPRIDVEVRAEKRSAALDISQICLMAVKRQAGIYRDFGLYLNAVIMEMGPTRIPDLLQETERYVTSLRLITLPDPDTLPALPS